MNALHLVHRRSWYEMYHFLTTPGQFCIAIDRTRDGVTACLVVKLNEEDLFVGRILGNQNQSLFILERQVQHFCRVDHLLAYYCRHGIEAGRNRTTLVRLSQPVYASVPSLEYLAGVVLYRSSCTIRIGEVPRYVLEDLSRHNGFF